jgi:hypothetical protein
VIKFIENNSSQIKICLYFKDLDFEFPHSIYQNQIKSQILTELEEEERKVSEIEDSIKNNEKNKFEREKSLELEKEKNNYEKYFEIEKNCKFFDKTYQLRI